MKTLIIQEWWVLTERLIKQVSKCILKGSLGAEMQSQLELRTL